MSTVAMLILICSRGVSPSNCQLNTALDAIRGPTVANEAACALRGQAIVAATAITRRFGDEYVKILCTHSDALNDTAQLEHETSEQSNDR
jgi:hypothetical protein